MQGVRQIGHPVFPADNALRRFERVCRIPSHHIIAVCFPVCNGAAELLEDALAAHRVVVAFFPLDVDGIQGLPCLPVAFRNHRHRVAQVDRRQKAGHGPCPTVIDFGHCRAEYRRRSDGGVFHAVDHHIDAELRAAIDLGRNVQPGQALAHQLELPGGFQSRAARGRLGAGLSGKLGVGGLAATGAVV